MVQDIGTPLLRRLDGPLVPNLSGLTGLKRSELASAAGTWFRLRYELVKVLPPLGVGAPLFHRFAHLALGSHNNDRYWRPAKTIPEEPTIRKALG